MSETTTATKTTTNDNGVSVRGKSLHWDIPLEQTWRFVCQKLHAPGSRGFIEMHQFRKNFTLYFNTEQLQEIRKALNEVLE